MNSQKYKIQALIAEIDEVLSKPAPRLPWTGSIDTVHQRQLLERVRAYLVSPDSKLAIRKGPSGPNVRPQPVPVPKLPLVADRPSAADQIMLAVTGEISNLRSSLTGPLQEDIEALRQEQQALIQEIKQLEAKRQQQQSLAQQQANQQQIISEFLQVLTARLEETLERDFSQILGSLENQLLPSSAAPYYLGSAPDEQPALDVTLNPQTSEEYPLLTPAQRLEQMQRFQASADSLLMRLDSTMGIVFEALEANLQTYQVSLSQGLENMYGLSQQSEAMFAAFVNHLVAQLGREASSYVQQPIARANLETATPTAADRSGATSALSNTAIDPLAAAEESEDRSGELGAQDRLPYAGTEISPQFKQLRRDRDRDRFEPPISLHDLEDNLSGSAPAIPRLATQLIDAESEDILAENGEKVEDLYASLFVGESVAEIELELEDFTIENTEMAAEMAASQSKTAAEYETAEPINNAEDLFVNLLDEGESLEDFLASEESEFVIGNSVDDLTLDTEDLLEPKVATLPPVSEPPALREIAPTVRPVSEPPALREIEAQLDLDDRENLETTQNLGDRFDTDALSPSPAEPEAPTLSVLAEIRQNQPSGGRVPSARDVQTGEFGTSSQGLDDAYIQASPDEDLLPVQALEDDLDRALNLDVNTLELLETDLYNLEGLDNSRSGRSNSSAVNSLDFSANSPSGGAENPFAEAGEEELGSLEDLFSDVLELSSDDEPFVLEDELEDDLFAEEDESNLTLDEILSSLNETDREEAQTAETNELGSSAPQSKKKT
ncbi:MULTISPECIES: hypothetical protein [unclassified Microcoleus]|uniref:hypothetical protein n=1 Tax=unclassified Microcoleus TaxID=2642155 RepID=UPI002FD246CA